MKTEQEYLDELDRLENRLDRIISGEYEYPGGWSNVPKHREQRAGAEIFEDVNSLKKELTEVRPPFTEEIAQKMQSLMIKLLTELFDVTEEEIAEGVKEFTNE